MPVLREAIARLVKVEIEYGDRRGRATRRVVWPLVIGFFDEALMLAAWCELRSQFRHFRLDRIGEARILDSRVPARRAALLREWKAQDEHDAADGF